MNQPEACFFLGANTSQGFVGYMPASYSPADGWRVYIIKSGPGSGKSTFMRRVWEAVTAAAAVESEFLYCSSDPRSLDGVRFPTLKTAIFDGTAPHVLEPRYWGACETVVDIGGCADNSLLFQNAAAIREATDACAERHARCRGYLATAASLLEDSRRIAARCTDEEKVRRTARRLCEQECSARDRVGTEDRRFLSALTPDGPMVWYSTLQALCPRIYVIEDEYGAAGNILLHELRDRALARGARLITCACPLDPTEKIEHVLLPEEGVGFTLSNPWHKADFPVYRRIHAARFTMEDALAQKRQRLAFNRRAARELLNEAVSCAAEAKTVHDEMERFTVQAMDFEAVDRLREKVTAEIVKSMKNRLQKYGEDDTL